MKDNNGIPKLENVNEYFTYNYTFTVTLIAMLIERGVIAQGEGRAIIELTNKIFIENNGKLPDDSSNV